MTATTHGPASGIDHKTDQEAVEKAPKYIRPQLGIIVRFHAENIRNELFIPSRSIYESLILMQ